MWSPLRSIAASLRRGVFPHEMAFLLELPWRYLVLSPRSLAARLPLAADSQVLEVGAGSGMYSAEVARRLPHGRLELVDLQPEMLARARRRLRAAGLDRVGYHTADAAVLPFPPNRFDVVYLVTVLGEVTDRPAFLREALRVLRPGGTLSISEHLPDPDFLSAHRVGVLAEAAGFTGGTRRGMPWAFTANFRKPA